jgi:hypothetical protein
MTDASKRALPSSRCRHGNRNPFSRANPLSSRSRHPPPVVALEHSLSLATSPRRRRPACHTLQAPPKHLPLLLPPPVCLSRRSQRRTCMSRARACVRYGGVWHRTAETPSTTLAAGAAVSAALVAWPKSIDVPLSGPKTPKLVEERPRVLDARRRRSPGPTDTLARRNSHRACPRTLPSSAWSRVALPYCRLPEKGTMLKPRCAAMIKSKKMGMMPRLGAIQWCRLRRDLPSRSLAPALGTKGGGKATAILNHLT